MKYVNGDIYSGEWKNGKKDGKGTYIFEQTKQKFVGSFKGGQIVKGEWQYPNGSFFSGNFDNNQPKGSGKWMFKNGNIVEGLYSQTKRIDSDTDAIKLAWKTTSDISQTQSAPAKA
mmetsp:Transcript_13595/g.21252  ORF Transcript_13595/g.21252 Transcript_13595/m.21252 type:complete len:116 (-) Transcript_13595:24-371(-)